MTTCDVIKKSSHHRLLHAVIWRLSSKTSTEEELNFFKEFCLRQIWAAVSGKLGKSGTSGHQDIRDIRTSGTRPVWFMWCQSEGEDQQTDSCWRSGGSFSIRFSSIIFGSDLSAAAQPDPRIRNCPRALQAWAEGLYCSLPWRRWRCGEGVRLLWAGSDDQPQAQNIQKKPSTFLQVQGHAWDPFDSVSMTTWLL